MFIGPFDLAKSMQVQFGGDEHEKAIATVLKATQAAGKYASIFVRAVTPSLLRLGGELTGAFARQCLSGEQARKRLDQGFDMVSIATDTASITRDLTLQLETVRA